MVVRTDKYMVEYDRIVIIIVLLSNRITNHQGSFSVSSRFQWDEFRIDSSQATGIIEMCAQIVVERCTFVCFRLFTQSDPTSNKGTEPFCADDSDVESAGTVRWCPMNPMFPSALLRTNESKIAVFSLPWNESIVCHQRGVP